jgi:hypothetical protein
MSTPTSKNYTSTPGKPTITPTPTTTVTQTPTPTFTPGPVTFGPDDFPSNVNPLTGLYVSKASLLNRRPIALKVNIVPRTSNRPPWGLSFADIVYDYYHNDGYTRFHAIYYGTDAELVGPIRSGRLLDHELIRMYESVFAYGSADRIVNSRLLNSEYSDRVILEGQRSNCPPTEAAPLCRYDPSGYDFLLAGTQAISEYIESQGVDNSRQDLTGMYFDSEPPETGVDGTQVSIRYSGDDYVLWEFNPITKRYDRYQDNVYDTGQGEEYAPLIDRLNDEQINAENVIIIFVRHEYYQQPPNEIVEILLNGSGDAYALRDGKMYQVTWNRTGMNSVLTLTNPDGKGFPFKPGRTWIQVVGVYTTVEETEDGVWRFKFGFP